jgi:hypothetical protein
MKGKDMTWSDMAMNWGEWFGRFKTRFPNLDDSAMPFVKGDRARFEAYVASTHDLTLTEAREELNDFISVEALAREAFDYRARAEG